MTKVHAADFRAMWTQLGSPLCEHLKVELEQTEDGDMTGTYRCTACGHAAPLKLCRLS